jgi:very-short-patch-repair endonuclease
VGDWGFLGVKGPPDLRVSDIAARQRGRVSRRQLRAAGLTDDMIKTRITRGQLTPTRRGVYAVGPVDTPLAVETEAILLCGPTACLSHLTAVRIWELLRWTDPLDEVQVTVVDSDRGRSHPGIHVHRSSTLARTDVRTIQRLPVTSVERTLVDAAQRLTPRQLERALDEALARRLTSANKLDQAVAASNSRGTSALRRLMHSRRAPLTITHSEAEERLLALIRDANLPAPTLQARLHGYSVDVYWPQARFAVEVDGYAWHTNKSNFTRDRRKDRVLADHGIALTRVTWDQLQREPLQLIAHFARRLPID